jgi:hypothetical protein
VRWRRANKGNSRKSCALLWPTYKDLFCSQNQTAHAGISFCEETEEKEKRKRTKKYQWVDHSDREPVGNLRARNIPFPVYGKWM